VSERPLRARWRSAVLDPQSGLSWAAKLAAAVYAEHSISAAGDLRYSPSVPTLAWWMGTSERVARRGRRELVEVGLLVLDERSGRTSRARLVLPTPAGEAGVPLHEPLHEPLPERQDGTRGTRGTSTSPTARPSSARAQEGEDERAPGAQKLVADYVAMAQANGTTKVPKRLIGQVANEVGQLVAEGIAPETIRAALKLLVAGHKHPSTLPSLIPEAESHLAGPGGYDWKEARAYDG
jgi:hypothetical protein